MDADLTRDEFLAALFRLPLPVSRESAGRLAWSRTPDLGEPVALAGLLEPVPREDDVIH